MFIAFKGDLAVFYHYNFLHKFFLSYLRKRSEFEYPRRQSTIFVRPINADADIDLAIKKLKCIFGIAAIQRSAVLPTDWEQVVALGMPYLEEPLSAAHTFKVEAKRSDKSYPLKTPDIQRELGAAILSAYPHLKVDVHTPDITVILEIRDGHAYLNAERIMGQGGMPVGSSGNALLLLSGGIQTA